MSTSSTKDVRPCRQLHGGKGKVHRSISQCPFFLFTDSRCQLALPLAPLPESLPKRYQLPVWGLGWCQRGSQQVGSCAIMAVFRKQSQVKRGMRERSAVTTCSYPLEKRFTMAVAHVLPEATAGHVEKKLLILVSSSFVHSCNSNYSCILWPFVCFFNFDFCSQCGHFFSHQSGTIGFCSQLCMSNVSDSGSAIFHTNDAAGAGGRTATQLSCEFV